MTAFVAASAAAEQVGTDRGRQMAALAKENAAKSLADLTDSAVVLEQASKWGLGDLVERNATFQRARKQYDAALAAYEHRGPGRRGHRPQAWRSHTVRYRVVADTRQTRRARRGRPAQTDPPPTEAG